MTLQILKLTTPKTFSWKRVTKFFAGITDAIIEARRKQAAMEVATHLKSHNRDFKDWSHSELVQAILSDKPIGLDKRPL